MIYSAELRSAYIWSFLERVGSQAGRFLISIVLARLLLPQDFGIYAVIAAILNLASTLVRCGLGTALITAPKLVREEQAAAFVFTMASGFFGTGLMVCLSTAIARYAATPELSSIARFSSLSILVNALAVVPNAMLVRTLRFAMIGKISVVSVLVSGGIALWLAAVGAGVWSLVAQEIAFCLVGTTLTWIAAGWFPQIGFQRATLRKILGTGIGAMGASVCDSVAAALYYAILPTSFTVAEIGLYSRARQLSESFAMNAYAIASRPSLSIFSQCRSNVTVLTKRYVAIGQMIGSVIFPLMGFLAGLSTPLIVLLLSRKWTCAAPIFCIMCIAGAFYPVQRIATNLLLSIGNSSAALRLELVRAAVALTGGILTFRFGLQAIAVTFAVTSLIGFLLSAAVISRVLSTRFTALLGATTSGATVGALMLIAMALGGSSEISIVSLAERSAIGLATYFAAFHLFRMKTPWHYWTILTSDTWGDPMGSRLEGLLPKSER